LRRAAATPASSQRQQTLLRSRIASIAALFQNIMARLLSALCAPRLAGRIAHGGTHRYAVRALRTALRLHSATPPLRLRLTGSERRTALDSRRSSATKRRKIASGDRWTVRRWANGHRWAGRCWKAWKPGETLQQNSNENAGKNLLLAKGRAEQRAHGRRMSALPIAGAAAMALAW